MWENGEIYLEMVDVPLLYVFVWQRVSIQPTVHLKNRDRFRGFDTFSGQIVFFCLGGA